MNVKSGLGPAVAAALVVALVTVGVNRVLPDRSTDDKQTITAIATLTANVANLSKQVEKLNEQPYATRADLDGISNRVTGLEQRFSEHERQVQSGRQR